MKSVACLIFLLVLVAVVAGTPMLRFASVLTRHGDRTPLKIFPNTLANWNGQLGVLTTVGEKQHYDLGQYYRKRYVDEHGLLSPYYDEKEVYLRSTNKQRTLESAKFFAKGLYPEEYRNGKEIPIDTLELKKDKLIYAYKHCPKLDHMRKEERKGEIWIQKENDFKEELDEISRILGTKVKISDCTTILNNINQERTHGHPHIDELVGNDKLMDFIEEHSEFTLRRKYPSREGGKLGVGELLHHLYARMETKLLHKENDESPHFVLLSAHDSTILTLFAALDVTDYDIPHYASHVSFELYEDSETKEPYVQILYNNNPLKIASCSNGLCTLPQFKTLVDESSIPNFHDSHCHHELPKDEL